MTPDVAFLLPAYNPGQEVFTATLRSLTEQTMSADIVVVDDGSRTPVATYLPEGHAITVLRLDENVGITRALNHGLEHILARGYRYVARIDCGDLCEPTRIVQQFNFMEAHPEIDLLGSLARIVTPDGAVLYVYGSGSGGPAAISRQLRNNAPLLHPTFFFRTDLIRRIGFYSTEYPAAEDYEFMLRTDTGTNIACLEDVLVDCVADPHGISLKNRNLQLRTRLKAQLAYFSPWEMASYVGLLRTFAIRSIPLRAWLPLKRWLKS